MTARFALSVVICTHKPRPDYLSEVVGALKTQTLARHEWELIVVDNASSPPVADQIDISWHEYGRVVLERELGLTRARCRGIAEALADLIVFVDDDNVLAPDYLEHVISIGRQHPFIGAFGGSVIGRFESEPPPALGPYLEMLALRRVDAVRWSNLTSNFDTSPSGAGMVVRKEVCRLWMNNLSSDPLRSSLGRRGMELASCEDTDLAYTSTKLGYGTGLFPQLSLDHLIPSKRVECGYLLSLAEKMAESICLLQFRWSRGPNKRSKLGQCAALLRLTLRDRIALKFELARQRGVSRAQTLIHSE